ncbi:prolipoprotein diacylglyceryl transferase [Paenibacillus assamensis]|uniref:prolipoprotein diacylglyceryl transferase n=1 Tax=Paenibacillus assamensis TaxID=311244 RepID=UPI000A0790AC|nr:prolipoprotein diacylglyceryl transferase [Paenibacillus assamensis]
MASTLLDPIAFKLGPISVYWYGLILGSAALAGLLIAMQEGKRFKIPQDFFMDLLLLGVPSALVGARAYYVAFKWDEYKHDPIKMFAIWEGGIAIYGALIGAVICAVIYVRRKGYNFWRIADICAPGLLLGQAIGRWGNFMNQEAYGGPVSESFLRDTLNLPNFIVNQMNVDGSFHHPTFLYESIWNIVGILLILVIRRLRFVRAGEIFIGYLMWYSIGRFFIEGLRTDSLAYQGSEWMASIMNALWQPMTAVFEAGYLDPSYGNIRISQLIAVLLVLVGIVFIIFRRVTGRAQTRYLDPIVSTKADAGTSTAEDKSSAGSAVQSSGSAVAEDKVNKKKQKDEQKQ